MDGRGYLRSASRARVAALAAAATTSFCAATAHAQYPVPYTPPATSQPSQSAPPQGQYEAQPQAQPQGQQYGAQPQGQGQYGAQQQGQYPPPQGQYGPTPNQDSGPSRQAFTAERISVEAGVRFGSNDLNLGVGGRAGYTLNFGLYVGGVFYYWFGESEEQAIPGGGTISASAHAWDLMGEVGYDFGVTPMLVIRPFGGFGVVHVDVESCAPAPVGCISGSDSKGAGEVGGAVLASLDGLYLGGDFRIMFASDTVFVIGANIGGAF